MATPTKDFAIPIVFPDYRIAVNTPSIPIDLPGRWLDFKIPATKNKVPDLGHAGILFVNGVNGLTRYYEYGRYDPAALGLVEKRGVPDVKLQNGLPTAASLANTLRAISRVAGQNGRIAAAFIALPAGAFARMDTKAIQRKAQNTNPRREPYALLTNSCLHFAKEVAEAGGAAMPGVLDPRPVGYIDKVRAQHPDLDYKPGGAVVVEGIALP